MGENLPEEEISIQSVEISFWHRAFAKQMTVFEPYVVGGFALPNNKPIRHH